MSIAPQPPHHPWSPAPHDPRHAPGGCRCGPGGCAPPPPAPSQGPRVHAIVATVLITFVGLIGAYLSMIVGALMTDGCSSGVSAGAEKLECTTAVQAFFAYGSLVAVLIAVALAAIGIGRARPGGHHGWPLAAWSVWGVFCAGWWIFAFTIG